MTTFSLWLPTRRADGSLKLPGVPAGGAGGCPAPAGDGVAGGFEAVDAVFCCGAGGAAGVFVDADGVEGVSALGAAAAAGAGFGSSRSETADDKTLDETHL